VGLQSVSGGNAPDTGCSTAEAGQCASAARSRRFSYKLELGNLLADATKAKVEEKKEEIKAKAEQQVKDKLEGLFGR